MSVFIGYPSFMAYQMMKGKKDNNDGFPSIPGMIARYSALGLTNEQMKENPVWVDKTGNGYDLQMKSFAWDGMSGCDGYTESFLGDKINWESEIYNSRKMSVFGGSRSKVSIIHNQHHFQTYVKISGIDDNEGKVRGVYFYNLESSFTEGTICRTDGIYKIDITELNERGVVGIWAYPAKKNEDVYDYPVTIEILPLYPGALVFDGVDDYGVCDNFPILTKEKGYTVVALRSYLAESIGYLVYNGTSAKQSAFAFERSDSLDTWSWGINSSIRNLLPKLMSYQTSNSYNNNIISTGTAIEGDKLIRIASVGGYSNVAIWELVFLDHDATEEELTKIKDYFVKIYPWLFPDQAWTVTGKTNEDEDRATITNITGNGNDLVLSNFGFIEGSGYNEEGEYAGYLVTDGVDDAIQSKRFLLHRNWTMVGDWRFMPPEKNTNSGIVKSPAIRLYNQLNNITIYINRTTNPKSISGRSIKAVCSDGRIYLDDWSEFLDTELQTDFDNNVVISIANYGVNFTKMIFKNLSFYDNQLLSKDDCIKAYNYLQTLKAK